MEKCFILAKREISRLLNSVKTDILQMKQTHRLTHIDMAVNKNHDYNNESYEYEKYRIKSTSKVVRENPIQLLNKISSFCNLVTIVEW